MTKVTKMTKDEFISEIVNRDLFAGEYTGGILCGRLSFWKDLGLTSGSYIRCEHCPEEIRDNCGKLNSEDFVNWIKGQHKKCKIEAILKETDGIVVVDEAYCNFSGKTFLPSLDKYENLVILRTLSKVGLAAMRIGILIGSPPLVHELNKVRLPYNLNTFSQIAARLYIENEAEFQKQADTIVSRRDELFDELKKIDGIRLYATDANFILFSCH